MLGARSVSEGFIKFFLLYNIIPLKKSHKMFEVFTKYLKKIKFHYIVVKYLTIEAHLNVYYL